MIKNRLFIPTETAKSSTQYKWVAALEFSLLLLLLSLNLFTMKSIATSMRPGKISASAPELVLQQGHSLGVNSAAFAPDGSWLASGGADNAILIWQITTGRHLRAFRGHVASIRSLAISPNGKWLASGSNDRTIKIWDVAAGSEMFTFSGHTGSIEALSFSPDGRWLASGSTDKTIRIWDLLTRKELKLLNRTNTVGVLTVSNNGELLASASNTEVTLWDTKKWQQVQTFRRHTAKVTAILFTGDNSWLASSSTEGAVLIWRVGADRERFALKQNGSSVLALSFASGGSLIAAHADGSTRSWNYTTGTEKISFAKDRQYGQVVFACFNSDATVLASSVGDRTLSLRNVISGEVEQILQNHSTAINSVKFSRDGRWFASAANDSSVRLWEVTTGRELPRLSGHAGYVTTIAFSPDSSLLASGSTSGEVKIWNLSSAQLAFDLPARVKAVNIVAFSADGRSLATAGLNHNIEIWDLETKRVRLFTGHSDEVTSLSFLDAERLVSAGRDKTIRVWDFKTGSVTVSLDNLGAEINALAASSDGNLIAAANSDNTVRVWNVTDAVPLKTLAAHNGEVWTVAFSPNGQILASGSSDHSVLLWHLQTGTTSQQLKGGSATITSVTFSNDGTWLFCGSDDGSITVWNSASGALSASMISMPDSDDWLVATPDGLFDGSPESWNLILWRFDGSTFNVLPVESFFNEFYYPGLLADIISGKGPKAPQDIAQKDRRQPRINLKVSTVNGTFTTRTIDIELEVSGAPADDNHPNESGANDLRLFRNGLLVKTWPGDVLQKSRTRLLRTTMQIVAGENRISSYAFNNDNIKSLDATTIVNGADNLKRQGAANLLVIGIGRYENPQYNLKFAVSDATEMGAQLRSEQERLGRYNPIVTIPLTDTQATKKNILMAITRLAGNGTEPLPPNVPKVLSSINRAQPEDAVVIYFSGHGTAVGDHFYLIPHDLGYKGSREKLDSVGWKTILAHSISDEELVDALKPMDVDQLLVVIDACNSGQALESTEKRRGPMNTRGLAQLAYEKGIYVLTASQSIEVAFEADALKHSYLAFALLEDGLRKRLADGNRDGSIFLKEWFDYANERVPQIRRMRYQRRKELVIEDEPDEQKVQRPRVFYTRETGARRFLVARNTN